MGFRNKGEVPEHRKARILAGETRRFIGGVATIRSGAAPSAVVQEVVEPTRRRERIIDPETAVFLAAVHARLEASNKEILDATE